MPQLAMTRSPVQQPVRLGLNVGLPKQNGNPTYAAHTPAKPVVWNALLDFFFLSARPLPAIWLAVKPTHTLVLLERVDFPFYLTMPGNALLVFHVRAGEMRRREALK